MSKTRDSATPMSLWVAGVTQLAPDRLRTGIVLGTLVVNLLVGLLGLALLHSSRQSAHERAATATGNLAQLIERDISATLDRVDVTLRSVAAQIDRQQATSHLDRRSLWQVVDEGLAMVPEARNIGIFDERGVQVCGEALDRCMHLNVADRDYFVRAKSGAGPDTLLTGPVQSRADGQWSMAMSRALRRSDGGFAGVVVAVVPLQTFQKMFAALDLGTHGAVSLRHESLVLLARHPGPMRMSNESDNRKVSGQLALAVAAHPAGGTYKAPTAIDGIERTNAYRRFARYPLYIIVGLASANFLDEWRSNLWGTAAFGAFFFGLTSSLAWLVLSMLQRRVIGEARVRSILGSLAEGVLFHDQQGRVVAANASASRILGLPRNELLGNADQYPTWATEHEDGRLITADSHPVQVTLHTGQPMREQVLGLCKEPLGRRWLSVNTQPVFEPGNTAAVGVVASITDITDRKLAESRLQDTHRQLEQLAVHDSLTGLFNRHYMDEMALQQLIEARRAGHAVSFIMGDLDHFKPINDVHGHGAGDLVLAAVGELLLASCRGSDVACRYGGEEFLLILPRTTAIQAMQRAEQIRMKTQSLRVISDGGTHLAVTMSMGVAAFPADGDSVDELIAVADRALYAAKHAGRNCVRLAQT